MQKKLKNQILNQLFLNKYKQKSKSVKIGIGKKEKEPKRKNNI